MTAEEEVLVTELRQKIADLERQDKKNQRELKRLHETMDLEKQVALAKANQQLARTIEQRTREKYMKLLLENCPDIILILDNSGRFVYCTDTFLRKTRIKDSELVNGRDFTEVFNRFAEPEWVKALAKRLGDAMEMKKSLVFEEIRNIGDDVRKYTVQFTPMVNLFGESEGAMMLFHDITDIEKAREEAEKARIEAEKASAAKSEFLSNMSHEIRTPMNAIIGMTAIAKAAPGTERKDQCLKKIEDASSHLLGVINDILDMSKIEANKLELSFVNFSFDKVIRRVVNVSNFRIEEKRQQFSVSIDESIPPWLFGDDQRLTQVLTNLLSNAVKFTPEGGKISLAARFAGEEEGPNGKRCVLEMTVTDSGIGIPAEQQARLFKSFEQADSGTSRKFGGTGLGLAISKRIVEMMDGRIRVDSQSGEGAAFSFTVKMGRGEIPEGENAEAPSGGSAGAGMKAANAWAEEGGAENGETRMDDFSGFTMLLADDVAINREIVMSILEDSGLDIDCAENGREALEKFSAAPDRYDMIFMDVQMPEMDGFEATRRIRGLEYPAAEAVPIIAMTANVFKEDIRKCLDSGMNDHLGKPLDVAEMLAVMRKYLKNRPTAL